MKVSVAVIYPDGQVKKMTIPEDTRSISVEYNQHNLTMSIEAYVLDGVERYFARTQSEISDAEIEAALKSI
ncbi:hypothetical protein [Superficieibacter sp. 1612_C1]|uniref:hypothetical protein n=1 Tax=Superficieibacter sp. 1612_C1 TaxID=2780382 RepID=UPI0018842C3B|nr:hypothetical protein [Superficieibacter sp. 1612_C1]